MYYSNGFVYGGKPTESIIIKSVKMLPDMMMLVKFSNEEVRLFDATCLNGDVFAPLCNEAVFMNCIIDHGVPTWCDGDIDCAPEFIYDNSYEYGSEQIMQDISIA